jgi:hypothetical protein
VTGTVFDADALFCRRCLAHENMSVTACEGGEAHEFVVDGKALAVVERLIQAGTLSACADMIENRPGATSSELVALFRGGAHRKRSVTS